MEEKREVTGWKGVNLEAVPKWFGMNGKKIQKFMYEESANKNIRNALLWFGFELWWNIYGVAGNWIIYIHNNIAEPKAGGKKKNDKKKFTCRTMNKFNQIWVMQENNEEEEINIAVGIVENRIGILSYFYVWYNKIVSEWKKKIQFQQYPYHQKK